ncbi:phage protein Gp36 family protein [Megalodesulfovibrio paquesii]
MYCTVPDVLALLPEAEVLQLADDALTGDLESPAVQAVLTESIEQAGREIDAFVQAIRPVPLDPVPGLIANIAAKLAGHHLWLRRPGVAEPEAWTNETARCRRLLEHIALGKLALGAESGAAPGAEPATDSSPAYAKGTSVMDTYTGGW